MSDTPLRRSRRRSLPVLALLVGCAGCAASSSDRPADAIGSNDGADAGTADAAGGGVTTGGDAAAAVDVATGDGTGATSTDGAVLSRGPAPAKNGTNYPFPQNRQSASC